MNDKTIILIKNKVIDDNLVQKILETKSETKLGLDMRNVVSIKSKIFTECLLSNKFKLFNLQNDVLAYLSLILKDGFLKSYMNKFDFFDEKRELIRRKFIVIS